MESLNLQLQCQQLLAIAVFFHCSCLTFLGIPGLPKGTWSKWTDPPKIPPTQKEPTAVGQGSQVTSKSIIPLHTHHIIKAWDLQTCNALQAHTLPDMQTAILTCRAVWTSGHFNCLTAAKWSCAVHSD